MAQNLDKRINAYRDDLADMALKPLVKADHYSQGQLFKVVSGEAPLFSQPPTDKSPAAQQQGRITTLYYGDQVKVFEQKEGGLWLQNARDHYVGYGRAADFQPLEAKAATHYVAVTCCYLYGAPSIKSAPLMALPYASQLCLTPHNDEWFMLALPQGSQAYIEVKALSPITDRNADPVTIAESFLGVPYLWGGGSFMGIDCSALMQVSFYGAGRTIPRDSDMQLADPASHDIDPSQLQRGDLVFWKGHVGIMASETDLIHANAYDMKVARAPLAKVIAGIEARLGLKPNGFRRYSS